MTQKTTIESGDTVAVGSPASTPCLIVCSSLLAVGAVVALDPGADFGAQLGSGLAADVGLFISRTTSSRLLAAVAAATWSAPPSIAHKDATGGNSPTGPTVTVALAAGVPGCLDDHTIVVTPTSATTATIAYDGATVAESITIPAELPAVLRGKVDLSGLTLSTLATKHLDFTSPASLVVTWTTPTSIQDIADQFNAQAIAAPVALRARIAQTITAKYLEVYSTAGGSSVTATIDATASDADTVLGFNATSPANLTTPGAPATYSLPRSGLVLTFPATGPYVAKETYTLPCVGPRSSLAAKVAAAAAARAQYNTNAFGFISTVEPIDTAANVVATVDAFETLRAQWLADPIAPRDIYFAVGGTWHTASAVRATNEANITAADTATLAAFATEAPNPNSVVEGDVYIQGAATLAIGSFRRSAAIPWVVKRAAAPRLAATVAEDSIPEVVLVGPDGLTYARDQNTATIHLDQLDGPGFFVLRTMADGRTVKFALGATRAGKTNRLRHDGDFAVACEAARLAQGFTELWEGQRPETNKTTGMIAEHERASRRDAVLEVMTEFFRPTQGLVNASDEPTVTVLDPPSGKFTDTGITPVKVSWVTLGTITEVDIIIAATGTSRATTIA